MSNIQSPDTAEDDCFVEGGVKKIIKKYVLFLGRHGVGKSNYSGCLLGKATKGKSGLKDGTKELESWTFLHDEYTITVFDSVGLTGVEETDLERFTSLQQTLQDDEGAKISMIFFCVQWRRLTEVDRKAIEFVKNICRPEMHSLIHVLVTHAPTTYLKDEESLEELRSQFSFLLKKEGDFESRMSFVDLLPPEVTAERFKSCPEATAIIRNEWTDFRNRLLNIVETSKGACLTKMFKRTSDMEDYVRLNRQKIIIFSLGLFCLVLALCYAVLRNTSSALEQERAAAQQRQEEIQSDYDQLKANYKLWIGLGNVVYTVGRSVGDVLRTAASAGGMHI